MSEDRVRCTNCGRSFGHRYTDPKARCMYCGGRLAGPGLEHLDLVEPDDAERPPPLPPRPVHVLTGTPSRWAIPITALHELAVLAMLVMVGMLVIGTLHRHDPLVPPSMLRLTALALLPLLWVGGMCLRTGVELLAPPARSVIAAVPLLVLGVALGLPSLLARTLARLHAKVFGLWGLGGVLVAFVAGTAWLAARHDPTEGAEVWLTRHHEDERLEPGWQLQTSGWTARLTGEGDGAFSLRIEQVAEERFEGSLTWIHSARVDSIRGAWRDNHLVIPYPAPPWVQRWWMRPGMRSTLELWIRGDSQLEGADLLFGHTATGRRAWQRELDVVAARPTPTAPTAEGDAGSPVLVPPVVLRPRIEVDDEMLTGGRAFALRLEPDTDPVLVTPVGVFGPEGGLTREVNPQMLPALVGEALFFDLLDGAMRARGTLTRPPAGARAVTVGGEGHPDPSRDVLSFTLQPGHAVTALQLREAPVAAEQRLWLPVPPSSEMDTEEALIAAVVGATWEGGFSIRVAESDQLAPQIGAPLLDSKGRVAGMLVGVARQGNAQPVGLVIPAQEIRTRLSR